MPVGRMPPDPENYDMYFRQYSVSSLREIVAISQYLKGWLFRGQADHKWPLVTSIERISRTMGCEPRKCAENELRMIGEFKKHAPLYFDKRMLPDPKSDSIVEWLSIMQHYGSPTRLLDFTRSLYIALFFAVQESLTDASIWAVNPSRLNERHRDGFSFNGKTYNPSFSGTNDEKLGLVDDVVFPALVAATPKLIVDVNPNYSNERLKSQLSLFLVPLDVNAPFMENLCRSLDFERIPVGMEYESWPRNPSSAFFCNEVALIKFRIDHACHDSMRRELEYMTIDCSKLFPDLTGFCLSMKMYLRP